MAQLVAAELGKLFSTRLWLWLLVAAAALVGVYASLNIAFADNTVTLPLDTAPGQQTLFAIAGAARPLVAVLAAITITAEFRYRTATTTFLATPQRGRVVGAKLIVAAAVGILFAAVCVTTVSVIALPWLSRRGIEVPLGGNGIPGTLAGVLAVYPLFAVLGVALGALLREQVATVVGMLIYLFVAEPIVTGIPALSGWTRYLPGPAGSALTGISITVQDFLEPLAGGLLLVGYALVLATAGIALSTRRDIM